MKRSTALILIVCILSLLVAVPTAAQGEIFVAAGNTVLPLTDAMPIKSNGAWYVDYRCFTEGTLKLSASYNASEKKLVLYDWDTTLIFDIATAKFIPVPFAAALYGSQLMGETESMLLHTLMNTPSTNLGKLYCGAQELKLSGQLRNSYAKRMIEYISHHIGNTMDIKSLDILHQIFE